MAKGKRNRKIRKLAEGSTSMARRIRKNLNASKYDSQGGIHK